MAGRAISLKVAALQYKAGFGMIIVLGRPVSLSVAIVTGIILELADMGRYMTLGAYRRFYLIFALYPVTLYAEHIVMRALQLVTGPL